MQYTLLPRDDCSEQGVDYPRSAVITGACGAMGKACARNLGKHYRLVLVDLAADSLEKLAVELSCEGFDVALTHTLDISQRDEVMALAKRVSDIAPVGALVNTAGVSPAQQKSWEKIVEINFLGTINFLDAFLPFVSPGTVAVCIASISGHRTPEPGLNEILDAPYDDSILSRLAPFLESAHSPNSAYGMATPAYAVSKYAVMRLVEKRSADWACKGGRLVSISPGLINTPMLQNEVLNHPSGQRQGTIELIPHQKLGTPQDIAAAVEFLVSDLARYINGCDLRIDYGLMPIIWDSATKK